MGAAALASGGFSHASLALTVGLAASAVIGSGLWGFALARRRFWRELAMSALSGTGVMLGWYVVLMFAAAKPGDTTVDTAAGAGVVLLGGPTFLTVSAMLGLGVAAAVVLRALRHNRASQSR
jgi:hypothetical protein